MKNFKAEIAILLVFLTFLNSCAVYQGNYSLNTAVDNGNKVKVKTQYNKFLVYNGNRYEYKIINGNNTWEITKKNEALNFEDNLPLINGRFPYIISSEGNYYGINDFNESDSWVKIDTSEIIEITKTKKQVFTKIVYQEDNYWGVVDEIEDMDLVPIYEDQTIKVSEYDPVLSVLGTILVTPVVIGILLLTPVEDDW